MPSAARARLPGVPGEGSPAKRARDRFGLVLARDEEEELVCVANARQRHRDSVDEGLKTRFGADDVPSPHVERGELREERSDVAVGAEPDQDEIEGADVRELEPVLDRALVAAELALDPVDGCRRASSLSSSAVFAIP